jgi:hypothetical protein
MSWGRRRWIAAVAVSCAVAAVATAGAATGTVQVSGVQTPVDQAAGTYLMSGDLVGWWYTTSIASVRVHPAGTVQTSGTEQFVGCLDADRDGACAADEPTGTLDFVFSFTGKYDTLTYAEVHGRCHHEITGGAGDFSGASGSLDFKDDPATGCASYSGHIRF